MTPREGGALVRRSIANRETSRAARSSNVAASSHSAGLNTVVNSNKQNTAADSNASVNNGNQNVTGSSNTAPSLGNTNYVGVKK
jgi:hypothetical protein